MDELVLAAVQHLLLTIAVMTGVMIVEFEKSSLYVSMGGLSAGTCLEAAKLHERRGYGRLGRGFLGDTASR
jgi:uncharacterized membrane protein